MSTTRYYYGDESDLEGLTRDDVERDTFETYAEAEERHEDMLSEVYGVVSVCGFDYDAGRALRELDPVAFRCGVSDSTVEVDLDDYTNDDTSS